MEINSKKSLAYSEINDLYYYSLGQEEILKKELAKVCDEIQFGKNNLLENQFNDEQEIRLKNRFYRRTDKAEDMVREGSEMPKMYLVKPDIKFPSEEEYINYNEAEKQNLEAQLYKRLAIIGARKANINNRRKYTYKDAYNRKLKNMEDFIYYAGKYNYMAQEEDKIAYGFTKDEGKGAVLLNASLPGYTRLSVHFGSYKNFYTCLLSVNNKLDKEGLPSLFSTYEKNEVEKIGIDVFEKNSYNLPTFGVINTGIINRDNYNRSMFQEQEFSRRSRNSDGSINMQGLAEYINILHSDFNDREVFYIAEKAGAGTGILEPLNLLLHEREKLKKEAKKNSRTLTEEYIFSMDNEEFSKMINSMAVNRDEKGDDILQFLIQETVMKDDNFNDAIFGEILKKANNENTRQILYNQVQEEIELNGLDIDLNDNSYNQLKEIALKVPIDERKKANDLEEREENLQEVG